MRNSDGVMLFIVLLISLMLFSTIDKYEFHRAQKTIKDIMLCIFFGIIIVILAVPVIIIIYYINACAVTKYIKSLFKGGEKEMMEKYGVSSSEIAPTDEQLREIKSLSNGRPFSMPKTSKEAEELIAKLSK